MPAQGFSSPIDIGLPNNPESVPDELLDVFSSLFNAIRILQDSLGKFTGQQTQDTTNFLAIAQAFRDTLNVGRMTAIQVVSGDTISAGHMVNLYDAGGNVLKVRRADATVIAKRAHGYVDRAYVAGDLVAVYLWTGYLGSSGLNAGTTYYLSSSTPGAITATAPVTVGMIRQEVGVGLGASDLAVKISTPVQL
jgi:hypothetical protein